MKIMKYINSTVISLISSVKRHPFLTALLGALIILFSARLFFCAEVTDEAYYTALSYRFVLGDKPFVDSWDITQTSAFFSYPLIWIYTHIQGGTEGLFLFTRFAFFAFSCFIGLISFFILKRLINSMTALFIAVCICFYAPFCIYNFSYNNIVNLLSLLASFLMLNAFLSNNISKSMILYALSGGVYALAVLAHPAIIFSIIVILPMIFFIILYKSKELKKASIVTSTFIIGGILIGIVVLIILLFSISYRELINNIPYLFQNPHSLVNAESKSTFHKFFSISIETIKNTIPYGAKSLYVLIVLYILSGLVRKRAPLLSAFVIIGSVILPWFLFIDYKYMATINYVMYLAILLPISLILITRTNNRIIVSISAFVYVPSVITFFGVSYLSDGGVGQAANTLFPAAIATIIILLIILTDLFQSVLLPHKNNKCLSKSFFDSIPQTILPLAVCIIFCFFFWSNTYRHENLISCNTLVKSGVYKGIYTTKENERFIIQLEKDINRFKDTNKSILVLEILPAAYLMSDMLPSSPVVWSPTYYYKRIKNSNFALDYYRLKGKYPDLILYYQPELYNNVQDYNYSMHILIRDNYDLIYETSAYRFYKLR